MLLMRLLMLLAMEERREEIAFHMLLRKLFVALEMLFHAFLNRLSALLPKDVISFRVFPINHNWARFQINCTADFKRLTIEFHNPFQFPVNRLAKMSMTDKITPMAPEITPLMFSQVLTMRVLTAGQTNCIMDQMMFAAVEMMVLMTVHTF